MSKAFEYQRLLDQAQRLDGAAFARALKFPVLYVEQFLAAADSLKVATLKGDTTTSQRVDLFFPLEKREGSNVFLNMITLGRAQNNDLVLEGEGISKFHAYFTQVGEKWLLVDAGSSFGTFVNDRKLEPRSERAVLEPGARVRFGNTLVGKFLDAATCHEMLLASSPGNVRRF